jgi:hypothetical protein
MILVTRPNYLKLHKLTSCLAVWHVVGNKFQVLAVGKKTYEKRPTINIQNFELTCEDSVKLLGIEIDYQLNFDTHISTICRKASQQLNIIKRLGPYLNRLNKLTIFHTFILSNFNFCPLAWHFCTEKDF